MTQSAANIAVIDGKTITQTVELGTGKAGGAVRIKAVKGGHYVLAEGEKGVAPENVTVKRAGKDLHLSLEGDGLDQPRLIIEDYYGSDSQLVGMAGDGEYYNYIASDAEQDQEAALLLDGNSSAQVLAANPLAGFSSGLVAAAGINWLALGALAATAIGIALLLDRDKGGSKPAPVVLAIPDQPVLDSVLDDIGSIQGALENGGITDDNQPTLKGTGAPGNTVVISDNGNVIGEALVGADGKWEFTPETPLADGEHSFVLVEQSPDGSASAPTDSFDFEVDTLAPGRATIDTVADDVGADRGPIANNGYTDDNTPTLSGTAEAGARVDILNNGVKIGETTADAEGNWVYTPDSPLADGTYVLTSVAVDVAGNVGLPSEPWTITIDTVPPEAPVIDGVYDDQGDRQYFVEPGDTTDDTRPTISGSAEAGSIVVIYDNGVEIGRADVDTAGNWTFEPELPLINGSHELTVKAIDKAGNVSDPSDPFDFDVLAGAPATPQITGVLDDVGTPENIAPDGLTNDPTPTVQGIGVPGNIISVSINGVVAGTALVAADGTWSFTPPTDLADGRHAISAIATHPLTGNNSEASAPYPVNVDTTPPAVAGDLELQDNVGPIQDPIVSGDVTDDDTPTLVGTAEPGTTVHIFDNGVLLGTAEVAEDGTWGFTPSPALADGLHSLTTQVVDRAGNESPVSTPIDFTVDTRVIEVSISHIADDVGPITDNLVSGDVTDDATPTLHGRGTPGGTVTVYVDGVANGTVVVGANGEWQYSVTPALAEGDYVFTATVTTAANGESAPTAGFDLEIDTTAPIPTIGSITDDVGSSQGQLLDGDATDDTTPTLRGTGLELGDKVDVYSNGELLGRADVQADGSWSFTPNPPLSEGEHIFTVIAEDIPGNRSEASDPWTVIVDTTAPEAQAVVTSMGKDSGDDSTDFVTNDGTAGRLIQGNLTAALATGETVQISIDGGATWMGVLLGSEGTWSFVDQTSHAGNWEIQTRVVDRAGNTNVTSQAIILDTMVGTPTASSWDGLTINVSFDSAGVEAGDKLHFVIDGENVEHLLSQSEIDAGTASLPWSGAENGRAESISVAMVDGAGNTSPYLELQKGLDVVSTENFNDRTLQRFVTGESYDFTNFVMTVTNAPTETAYFSGFGNGTNQGGPIGRPPSTTALEMGGPNASVKFDLKDSGQFSRFSFTVGDLTSDEVLVAIFYNDDGVEIYRDSRSASDGLETQVDFELPYGLTVASIGLTLEGSSIGATYIWIDNIQFSENTYVEGGLVAPETNQTVSQAAVQYYGGDADNIFSLSDADLLSAAGSGINGGAGIDTIKLSGSGQTLDLIELGEKITSIEVIDLTGTGNNTLSLSLNDILNQGETDLFHESGKVQMMIKGDAGDVVDLDGLLGGEDPGSWASLGQVTVAGVAYDVYQHSAMDAELLVQQGVTTNFV